VSIPIKINNIGGVLQPIPLDAFETFFTFAGAPGGLTSSGAATTMPVGSTTRVDQLYSGTIAITQGVNGTGGNFLTTQFSNADLNGFLGGQSASLDGSRPPQNVLFTSNFALIIPLIAGNPPENFSLSFSNLAPSLTVNGNGTISNFTAQNTGTFATAAVPEPASVVMASLALVAGLGTFGWRRLSSRA